MVKNQPKTDLDFDPMTLISVGHVDLAHTYLHWSWSEVIKAPKCLFVSLTLNALQLTLNSVDFTVFCLYSSFAIHKSADTTGWVHFKAISPKASADLWKEIGHHMIFVMIFNYHHKNHVMSSPNLCDDWNVIIIQSYVLLL